MNKIAKFEKISFENFLVSCINIDESLKDAPLIIKKYYDDLILPKRATTGSAGYDFFAPYPVIIKAQETVLIPTGIRVSIEAGWVLQIFPRSGLGFKYRLQLDNTVGIIDSDYYYSDNEGHIFIKLTNDSHSDKDLIIKKGDGFAQGIFLPFGITTDDVATEKRNGGFGSTNKEKNHE